METETNIITNLVKLGFKVLSGPSNYSWSTMGDSETILSNEKINVSIGLNGRGKEMFFAMPIEYDVLPPFVTEKKTIKDFIVLFKSPLINISFDKLKQMIETMMADNYYNIRIEYHKNYTSQCIGDQKMIGAKSVTEKYEFPLIDKILNE